MRITNEIANMEKKSRKLKELFAFDVVSFAIVSMICLFAISLSIRHVTKKREYNVPDSVSFTISGCEQLFMGELKEEQSREHQTLILFYWHHDTLNLFINFCSAPCLFPHCPKHALTHSSIKGKGKRNEKIFLYFFFVIVLWRAGHETEEKVRS